MVSVVVDSAFYSRALLRLDLENDFFFQIGVLQIKNFPKTRLALMKGQFFN